MLKRRRPTAADRRTQEERGQYKDRNGIPFASYHTWLPSMISNWPTPKRVTEDKDDAQGDFHRDFDQCWWCGKREGWDVRDGLWVHIELHHLCAGYGRGKSHERFLFAAACRECHDGHVAEADLGRWLFLKWKHDQSHCDWVFTALRLRRFLPDLITERP